MLTCELSVNGRVVGTLTAHRTTRRDGKGRYSYGCIIRTPEGVTRNAIVWHDPSDGIWALVQLVIKDLRPEKWFPGPDKKEG
jgi:hypothetical protein